MNELSLFTGIGGGLLGTKLLGWNHIGYVEWDKYCCRDLEQRIKDGILDDAPIWNIDIREFNKQYAEKYRGLVDVITAGFPCQPFSVAGKRAGADDERNMWPATIKCIRLVRPRYALLENVPGLLTSGYFGTILGDLAESGYNIRWRCLSAAEVGANHKRNRLWIMAYSKYTETTRQREYSGERLSEPESIRLSEGSKDVADAKGEQSRRLLKQEVSTDVSASGDRAGETSWWSAEPDVGRLAHGVPNRVDRLKAIGNGQVPLCIATAWKLLSGMGEDNA